MVVSEELAVLKQGSDGNGNCWFWKEACEWDWLLDR